MIETFFLSDIKAHLKVNGEYKGVVSNNLKSLNIPNKNVLFEFMPINDEYGVVYGDLNGKNVKVFNLSSKRLVCPVYTQKNSHPFKVITQKHAHLNGNGATVTVTLDGCVKFYLDGVLSDVNCLPFIPKNTEIYFYQNLLILEFFSIKTALYIYDINSKEKIYCDVVDEYAVNEVLTVKKTYQNVTKTIITQEWNLNGKPTLINVKDTKLKEYFSLKPCLIALSFFENVLIGASVKEIVTPNFNQKISQVKEFLGNVIKVVVSPLNKNECWLIKNEGVTVCTLRYENNLIDNMLAEDY